MFTGGASVLSRQHNEPQQTRGIQRFSVIIRQHHEQERRLFFGGAVRDAGQLKKDGAIGNSPPVTSVHGFKHCSKANTGPIPQQQQQQTTTC